jgi:glutathione peroxidase
MTSITEIPVKTSSGEADLSAYAGQVLLIVNTASKCGFTPQYEGLEALQRRYAGRGFSVLAFPVQPVRRPGTRATPPRSPASAR